MTAKSIVKASGLAVGMGALLLGTAIVATTGASASDPSAQPEAKAEPDQSRRVCRTVTPSGSRLTRRICRTQAEWDASADRAADGVAKQQIEDTTQLSRGAGPL